jgi:hypothetical protein
MKRALIVALACVATAISISAQGDRRPTCRNCPSTFVPKAELQAYIARAIANNLVDQQVRAIDVGRMNVGVAVVYRGKLAGPAPNSVAEHHQVSEVYHVIDGAATIATGPELISAQERPADSDTVRLLNGPGSDHISHLMVPDKIVPLKDEAASKADLSRKSRIHATPVSTYVTG